jgi:hypothetical protein
MGSKETAVKLKSGAEAAIKCIGLGYDVAEDLRLNYCKHESQPLISIDDHHVRDIVIPGGILIPNVSKSVNCDKGERMRFSSDVITFQQMSEQFNQEVSLSGKIPTGQFNAAFEFTGSWQKDAANTKALAFDGVLITIYSIALGKTQITLRDHIKQAVPSSWDPAALARFIEKFGTHVIVGVKMGGKDIVYVKQQHSSPLQPDQVQKRLKDVADKRFSDAGRKYSNTNEAVEDNEHGLTFMDSTTSSSYLHKEDITLFWRRRGGSKTKNLEHSKWCQSVQTDPDVISMSFIPISSLLNGVHGSGFLSHAINLYLRYKPPIEELHQFLEFQLPRQWAPVFGDLAVGPERKQQSSDSLQFSFMGPKLYVNSNMVDVGKKPVTGLRLYLEGKRNNCLAIHLQHLSSLPKSINLQDDPKSNSNDVYDRRYYERVQWKSFSHVCTAPIESSSSSDEMQDLTIVTGAQFEVRESGMKRVLFLRLNFSTAVGSIVVKKPEWDGSPALFTQKSGMILNLFSSQMSSSKQQPPRPSDVNVNSALYPGGPPVAAQATKLLRFVDTTEMMRGPQDPPGYWVVSGAKLVVDKGKISLRVKYSLLAPVLQDDQQGVIL